MNIHKAIAILDLKDFKGIEDLKRSFRKKAHQYHPDKNKERDTSEIFREILNAYEYTLGNISEVFDHFGVEEQPEDEVTAKVVIENLDDIFEDIFGFSKGERVLGFQEPQVLYLKLEDLVLGAKRREKLVSYKKCPDCKGVGAQKGSLARVCTYCFGQGMLKGRRQAERPRVCPRCQGRGRKIAAPCVRCNGYGRLKQWHAQEFTIPVGLQPHEIYTIEGLDLETKTKTEIFIEPRLLRHSIFQIDNYNLVCEYHLDFSELEKDARVNLMTPFGKVPVVIKKNAVAGDVIRVKNAGLYKDARKKERGDLVVLLKDKKHSFFKRFFGGWFD